MNKPAEKAFLRALKGERVRPVPFWLMRQAGRYLPEYRATRAEAKGFLELCFSPDFAVEVTLQPLKRFGMDAAILFSDILVLPYALGRDLAFREGEGPCMTPLRDAGEIDKLDRQGFLKKLAPVFEIVSKLSKAIPEKTALIGFAGAPWTVATYMVEGGSSKDYAAAKTWGYRKPEEFGRLIDFLADATADYLLKQIEAGAEAVQIFDSWAGALAEAPFRDWVIDPTRRIVERIRGLHPEIPIIGFPRGAGALYEAFVKETGVDAVSLDSQIPLAWAASTLQPHCCVQGNLDPMLLVAGGKAMEREIRRLADMLGKGAYVFNLGHGIVPQTPPENVARLAEIIRSIE